MPTFIYKGRGEKRKVFSPLYVLGRREDNWTIVLFGTILLLYIQILLHGLKKVKNFFLLQRRLHIVKMLKNNDHDLNNKLDSYESKKKRYMGDFLQTVRNIGTLLKGFENYLIQNIILTCR